MRLFLCCVNRNTVLGLQDISPYDVYRPFVEKISQVHNRSVLCATALYMADEKRLQNYLPLQPGNKTFLYFAFGSNLLKSRIRINSPSATLIGVGRLPGYKLGFSGWSDSWQGAVANIFKHGNAPPSLSEANELLADSTDAIWGAVWSISCNTLDELDRQEGVHLSEYEPIDVVIELFRTKERNMCPHMERLRVFSAQQSMEADDRTLIQQLQEQIDSCDSRSSFNKENYEIVSARAYRKVVNSSRLPDNVVLRLPSDTYKLVILKGAVQCGLPLQYIKLLSSLRTNCVSSSFDAWKLTL